MERRIASVTLLVDDHEVAVDYFVGTLGFELVSDTPRDGGDRWVVVAPKGGGTGIRLAFARDERQRQVIGAQAGGRVFVVMYTDDLDRDYRAFMERGITFLEPPRKEPYGAIAVFADMFGNRWDLIQPSNRLVQ